MNIKSEEGSKEKNGDIIEFIGKCISIHETPSKIPKYYFLFGVKKVLKGDNIYPPFVNFVYLMGVETEKIFEALDLKIKQYENRQIKISEEIKNKEFIIKVKHIEDKRYKFLDIDTKK